MKSNTRSRSRWVNKASFEITRMQPNSFRRFLALTRPHRSRIAVGVSLSLAATLLALPAPWILKLAIDDALPRRNLPLLGWLLTAFTALFLLRGWLTMQRNRILQFSAMRIVCDLRIQLFAHLQTLSLRYFDANQTGTIISRITQDTNEIYQLTNGFLINLIADSVTVVCVLGFLFWIEWRLPLSRTRLLPLLSLNSFHNPPRLPPTSHLPPPNSHTVIR